MKKILIPVDFSEQAEYAVEVGVQIAKKVGGKVRLLHTIDMVVLQSDAPSQVTSVMEVAKALEMAAERKMTEWKNKPVLEGVEVTTEIKIANTFHSIIGEAGEYEADLVVMGTKGASGLKEFALGSNAEKVVRWSEIPVLTVKERNLNFSINDILFVSNFYGEIDSSFKKIKDFFAPFNAKFHLLKVITPSNFEPTHRSVKIIEDFAKKAELENYSVNTYNDSKLENGIKNFDEMMNPDVVVILTHGRKGLSHFIYGSKAENTVNHIQAPIMTFKINEPDYEYGVIFPELR